MWKAISATFLCFSIALACNKPKATGGQALYEKHCGNCHLANGQGIGTLMPPIKNSDYFLANRSQLACIIVNGLEGEIEVNNVTYNNPMLPVENISEVDIVNILNYIQGKWYKEEAPFSLPEIKQQLSNCN